ncbi:MAG: hypothetical protein SAJ12_00290 [Jaaginema sp. PMC 1079.18]|nr:hypothetical protein [Jaaginema sp. PMC 1080.18]MEC4849421.1 hypothetical protein [Jaaginema sp. PMC 1079.18]MEC4864947.1 hypothetical protein [Jaaginema sp. PMC 1078.18]
MLTSGNVVTTATILYRSHLKTYLKISLVASLWLLVPIVLIILASGISLIFTTESDSITVLIFFLIATPIWLFLAIYCCAKSWLNSSLISRLSFQELINRPESVKQARKAIASRLWMFFLSGFLVGVIYVIVYILDAIALGIVTIGCAFIIGGIFNSILPGANAFIGLVTTILFFFVYVAAFVAFFYILGWYYARLFLIEVPLAVGRKADAFQALAMSWKFTKNNIRFTLEIVSITCLVNFPLWAIVQIFSRLLQLLLIGSVDATNDVAVGTTYLLSLALGILGNVILLPFWQAVKAVTYYDLCCRQEGLGLALREGKKDRILSM